MSTNAWIDLPEESVSIVGPVSVTQGTSPWVVSGTVSVNPITFASPQHVIVDSGTLTSITNAVTVNQGTSPWVVSMPSQLLQMLTCMMEPAFQLVQPEVL